MDFDSLQDDSTAQPQATPAPGVAPNFDSIQDDSEKYSTPEQQGLASIEGATQGFLGETIGKYALKNLIPGENDQDIEAREQYNPWTHGISKIVGLGTGIFTGTGEAGVAGNIAEHLVPEGVTLAGKIGSMAMKGAIENGLFQTDNEISKAMLGRGDPEDPVGSAIAHIGAAGLLGAGVGGIFGGLGSKLKSLGDAEAGTVAKNEIANFGKQWQMEQQTPDLLGSVTKELSDLYQTTTGAVDNEFGTVQLKDAAIKKLAPQMNDGIRGQNQEIASKLENTISEMVKDPDSYPGRLTKQLMTEANNWMQVATDPNASSFDVFKGTEQLKQKLALYAKFGKSINPLAPEGPFINTIKSLGHDLRTSLEDPSVWGDAGDLQKQSNAAYSEFIKNKGPLDTFEKRFTTNNGLDQVINPGAVNTYLNQLGKPAAEIKQDVVQNFVDAAEKYRDAVNNIHAKVGVERPLEPVAMNATKGTYGETTPGAEFAKHLYRDGLPSLTDSFGAKIATTTAATALGAHEGGAAGGITGFAVGQLAPYLEKMIRKPFASFSRNYAVPGVLKALSSGSTDHLWSLLDHANNVARGAQKINSGMDALFKSTGNEAVDTYATEKDREKIKEFLKKGGVQQQMQEQLGKQKRESTPGVGQSFSDGGEVKPENQFSSPDPGAPPLKPVLEDSGALAGSHPDQNMLLQAARGRVSNYLGSLQPQPSSKLPFDTEPNKVDQERTFNRAIDIASQPLSVLNHIKAGTLTPDTMKHFTQLYPELYNHLSKKMTERMLNAQLDDEKPNYKTRQSMGLFLGASLDSTMTPQAIASIQSMYSGKQAQAQSQAPQKTKKGTAKMNTLSENLQTPDQARSARANKA